ncbi:MAG: HAD family hydrolase [Bacteriovorax sp.]|nr:HAD family hydrolase [Bacteriovorax sp.]
MAKNSKKQKEIKNINGTHLFSTTDLFQTHTMKLKTLLIDLDGTILGAHSFWLSIFFTFNFVNSLRKHGFPVLEAIRILHKLKLAMRQPSHQKNGIINWTKAVTFFSQLSGKSFEDSKKILTSTSLICFQKSRATLYAQTEAKEFIAWAKNHYRLILATNPLWPLEVVLYRLSIAEIHEDNFEFITHAGNMSASKPHVEYYQELQSMKDLAAGSCLMIGNDEKKDGPAREIGVEVFIIERSSDFIKLRTRLEKDQSRENSRENI